MKGAASFTPLTDVLFIRRAMRESLQRSLTRFARELRGDRERRRLSVVLSAARRSS